LRQATRLQRLLKLNQEIGTDQEVFRFVARNPTSRKTLPLDSVTLTSFL
jgi:hypothetical protein